MIKPKTELSDLQKILRICRQSFVSAGFFSLFINLLMLAPSLYMHAGERTFLQYLLQPALDSAARSFREK